MSKPHRESLLKEADLLTAWADAWFWQIYKNQQNVYQVRAVLRDSADRLRILAGEPEAHHG